MYRIGGRALAVVVMVVAAGLLTSACAPPPSSGGGGTGIVQFDPRLTDPAITSDTLSPSFAYMPSAAPRGELVVLFNGTGAGPTSLSRMGGRLAASGFHVIGLRYVSAVGTLSACPDSQLDTNPDCHRQFRGEVVHGAGVADPSGAAFDHPSVNVSGANSVLNRLLKHIEYLHQRYPAAGWDAFQQREAGACTEMSETYGACMADWGRIVAMGHSQGAGVALYLGKHYPLGRVGMLSGPYDVFGSPSGYVPAPWVAEGGFAVPVGDIATFSHLSDPAIGIHRAVSDTLGLAGPEVLVTLYARPYGYSQRLVTNAPTECPFDTTAQSHNSTATDLCAPPVAHDDAWRYLATGH
jgi:hypothetical protein